MENTKKGIKKNKGGSDIYVGRQCQFTLHSDRVVNGNLILLLFQTSRREREIKLFYRKFLSNAMQIQFNSLTSMRLVRRLFSYLVVAQCSKL